MKTSTIIIAYTVIVMANLGYAREVGICSWYGAAGPGGIPLGHPTASGEGFNRFAMKAAHKWLPFGTCIRVWNLSTPKPRKSVYVSVNDRGPFAQDRIVDLTYGAFGKIAQHSVGIVKCGYKIVNKRYCR